ncbi:MAG TPA: sigma-70 family RNA polymerase sigma factor [Acidobacteriaceae bacterium]
MITEAAPNSSTDEGQEPQRKLKTWDDIAAHKQRTMREQIGAAYEAYMRSPDDPTSERELFDLIKRFVHRKVRRLEFEFKEERGTAQTADDWTQDAVTSVWIAMPRLLEAITTGEEFYFYLNKVAFNRRNKAGGYLVREKNTNVSLMVSREDEDGEPYEEEHPQIHNRQTTINEGFVLPSMAVMDEAICLLIADGKNYAQIGQELKITEDNVKKRLQRLRGKVGADRAAERAKNFERWRPSKIQHPSKTVQIAEVDVETAVTA